MRTDKNYILRRIDGNTILIPTGKASMKLNGMIRLTETAAWIWSRVDTAEDLNEIIHGLTETFDIDTETAERDVYGFLGELYKRGMVLDIPELENQ